MKIIQIIPNFALAGAEIMCENLIYGLRAEGHDVIAVSLYRFESPITKRLEEKGVRLVYLDKKPGFDLSIVSKLRKLFKAEKPDVVHTHLYVLPYVLPAAIFSKVKRRVHTVHNVAEKENGKLGRFYCKIAYKWFHVTPVALSKQVQNSIVDVYKISAEKIPVIFNGIDLSSCLPKTDYKRKSIFNILHVGRFAEQKNHKVLLQAFKLFHEQNPDSALRLIGDGTLKTEMEEYVQSNGLTDCVEFLGLQANVHPYMQDADIFTLPSLYEGVPMTLIEAMGTGLPIVASNVGGIPDMLDENSGILLSIDEQTLSSAFNSLYHNQELRENIGKNALTRAKAFSAGEMAKNYSAVYTMHTIK